MQVNMLGSRFEVLWFDTNLVFGGFKDFHTDCYHNLDTLHIVTSTLIGTASFVLVLWVPW